MRYLSTIILILYTTVTSLFSAPQKEKKLPQSPEISHSVTPFLDNIKSPSDLVYWKYDPDQFLEIQEGFAQCANKIRFVTYNILYQDEDAKYSPEYQTDQRLPRVVAAIKEMNPDIIAVQECFQKHVDYLLAFLGDDYAFSCPVTGSSREEINTVLYKKNRFQLMNFESFPILRPEEIVFDTVMCHTVTKTVLKDMFTKEVFAVFNTHLEFMDAGIRKRQADEICKLISETSQEMGVIFCGDLNTFPNRMDLSLPAYDGDKILQSFEANPLLKNTLKSSLLGHIGPIASFTNDPQSVDPIPFKGQGTPGVILDHVFATKPFITWIHAINPLKVNGFYPSDHMPVIVDFILEK